MAVTQTQSLILRFLCADGKLVSFTVPNPKEDLTQAQVTAAMQAIVTANIFDINGVAITGVAEAYITDLTKTDVVALI